jgi:hypothetical protein
VLPRLKLTLSLLEFGSGTLDAVIDAESDIVKSPATRTGTTTAVAPAATVPVQSRDDEKGGFVQVNVSLPMPTAAVPLLPETTDSGMWMVSVTGTLPELWAETSPVRHGETGTPLFTGQLFEIDVLLGVVNVKPTSTDGLATRPIVAEVVLLVANSWAMSTSRLLLATLTPTVQDIFGPILFPEQVLEVIEKFAYLLWFWSAMLNIPVAFDPVLVRVNVWEFWVELNV